MVGTVEQALDLMRKKNVISAMSKQDREMLGVSGRLEIPWTDRYDMRRIADLVRGWCATVETYSRREDLDDSTILLKIKMDLYATQSRIRDLVGPNRFNKNGTTRKTVDTE